MPYTPPLIKPLIPPLRPSAPFPFRTPGINRPPQIAPIYQPPDLVPPTGLDLKGVICIYSNPPIWEPKKIRYRYPGENWQEIAGENYTLNTIYGNYNQQGFVWIKLILRICFLNKIQFIGDPSLNDIYGPFDVEGKIRGADIKWKNGFTLAVIEQEVAPGVFFDRVIWSGTYRLSENYCLTDDVFSPVAGNISKSTSIAEIVQYTGQIQCEFKVFGIFNQEILSITRNTCPEVLIIPERCYFQPENEKLARKVNLSPNMDLRVEYSGNCATVWMDLWPLNYFPVQVYKECSDNPNCPPPKIRFDKKCEKKEKCEQCPKGTAAKVLIGLTIACVDKNGCIKKIIKYKPGCNTYDCVC